MDGVGLGASVAEPIILYLSVAQFYEMYRVVLILTKV